MVGSCNDECQRTFVKVAVNASVGPGQKRLLKDDQGGISGVVQNHAYPVNVVLLWIVKASTEGTSMDGSHCGALAASHSNSSISA